MNMNAQLDFLSATPHPFIMEVTPDTAKRWLRTRNPGNRKMNQASIESHVRSIKNDCWDVTNQGIGFDINGMIIDGHHRLEAIVKAGVTVELLVVTGLPVRAVQHVDINHRSRTCANVWQMNGEKNANVLAAGARLLYMFLPNGKYRERNRQPTLDELDAVLEEFPELRNWASFATSNRNAVLKIQPSIVVALGALFGLAFPPGAKDFFIAMLKGNDLSSKNPIFVTREYIMKRSTKLEKLGARKIMWLIIKAWNAQDECREMSIARVSPYETFPAINGLDIFIDI